jgi:hypothetical protein
VVVADNFLIARDLPFLVLSHGQGMVFGAKGTLPLDAFL